MTFVLDESNEPRPHRISEHPGEVADSHFQRPTVDAYGLLYAQLSSNVWSQESRYDIPHTNLEGFPICLHQIDNQTLKLRRGKRGRPYPAQCVRSTTSSNDSFPRLWSFPSC